MHGMIYTTGQAAAQLGCAKDTVRRQADDLKIGQQSPLGLLLTAAEIEQIRGKLRPVGNPNFKPGNYFGDSPKKRKNSGNKQLRRSKT